MNKPRHLRMTDQDRTRKVARQRDRRKFKPSRGMIRYALGNQEYDEVFEDFYQRQQGKCYICDRSFLETKPHMDHCHDTLKIRGLLCFSCNSKLGFTEKYLLRIVEYLTKDYTR